MSISRRSFLVRGGAALSGAALAGPLLPGCTPAAADLAHIQGQLLGPNAAAGHLLRDPSQISAPTRTVDTDVLIIGGGVAGLSAQR